MRKGYCSRFVCLSFRLSEKLICQLVLVNVQLKALAVQAGCIHRFETGVFLCYCTKVIVGKRQLWKDTEKFVLLFCCYPETSAMSPTLYKTIIS